MSTRRYANGYEPATVTYAPGETTYGQKALAAFFAPRAVPAEAPKPAHPLVEAAYHVMSKGAARAHAEGRASAGKTYAVFADYDRAEAFIADNNLGLTAVVVAM